MKLDNWIILLSFVLFVQSSISGQVQFFASSDARQVVTGQYFDVTFTLDNARGSNFRAPSFREFNVAGGPSTSTQMTIINGQRQQKVSYTYTLTATKVGTFTLGPASIDVNGKTLKSQGLKIEVVKGSTKNKSSQIGAGDFVVEAVIDYDTGYVGQQLILKYVLTSTKDVRSYNFGNLPEFDGFFAQEIQNYRSRPEQIVIDGVPHIKRILKVIALYPQQRGRFNISSAPVTLGISDGKRSNSFFFNTRLKQFRVQSTELDIAIIETPPNAPISFSGAIGDFFMGSRVDKKSVTMDDAVTLTLQVRGFGDGKFIEAPEQPYTDLFDIYDPNLLQENKEVVGDRMQITKTYEYLMIPKKTGVIKFNPEFTFFNVDSSEYETIYGQQYAINVIKGSERELADLEEEIVELPAPPQIDGLSKIGQSFAFSPLHLGANGVFLCGLIGLFFVKRKRMKEAGIDPAIKRKLRAQKIAISKLSSAKEALDQQDIKEYYIQLRKTLQEYLADKTNLPTTQLSKDDIAALLRKYHIVEQLDPLMEIMRKGEQAIYASIAPGQESGDYEKSIEVIGHIEEALS